MTRPLNLMPWRERRRARALLHFRLALVGSLVLALASVLLLDQLARARLARQVAASAVHVAQLDGLARQQAALAALREERATVLAQQAELLQLRAGQQAIERLLAGLESAMPDDASLTELSFAEGRLQFAGRAPSALVVGQFMRNLQGMGVASGLELVQLRRQGTGMAFLLTARLPAGWS